jgi:hypothetical protein
VQLVGWLFFALGVCAAVAIVVALLFERRINISIEVLGLWIGPGLLRHEARYRVWAMRLLILNFCVAPFAAAAQILAPNQPPVTVFGFAAGSVPLSVAFTALALLVGVSAWQYRVLSQSNVRALFTDARTEHAEASV